MSRLHSRLLTLFLLFLPTFSVGTTFFAQPFPKTVDQAPVIVKGKIGMHYSDWGTDPDGTKRIYTYYELKIEEVLKGSADTSRLIVRELGGEKDGIGLHVPGTAQFETGEQTVVFLRDRNSNDSYDIQGMMLGKYSLETDSEGHEYIMGAGIVLDSEPNSKRPNKLKLDALRQIIREQSSQKQNHSKITTVTHPTFTASPTPTPPSHPVQPALLPAPQLQSQQTEDFRKYKYFLLFLALLGTLVLLRGHRDGTKS